MRSGVKGKQWDGFWRPGNKKYKDGWNHIFGKKKKKNERKKNEKTKS